MNAADNAISRSGFAKAIADAERTASVVTTRHGRYLDMRKPEPEMIDLRDIAWNLSMISADPYANFEYSLAQRAVMTAETLSSEGEPAIALHALIADAAISYAHVLHTFCMRDAFVYLPQALSDLEWAIYTALELDPTTDKTLEKMVAAWMRVRATELRYLRAGGAAARFGYRPLGRAIMRMRQDKAFDNYCRLWAFTAIKSGLPVTDAWRATAASWCGRDIA